MAERKIVLTGFMGAGKTTVAQELALQMGCAWRDLDDFIMARTGRAVPDIIDQDGEARFRDLETAHLRQLLANPARRVIALGGGAWANPGNRRIIMEHNCLTVWLDAPFDICWQRIAGTARPLARHLATAQELYAQRQPSYRQAELRLDTTRHTAAELAQLIRAGI